MGKVWEGRAERKPGRGEREREARAARGRGERVRASRAAKNGALQSSCFRAAWTEQRRVRRGGTAESMLLGFTMTKRLVKKVTHPDSFPPFNWPMNDLVP